MHTLVSTLLLLALPCVSTGLDLSRAPAPPPDAVRLVEITAPTVLEAGTISHFRARVAEPVAQPVSYLWDLGDGTLSIGALVSHAYKTPGAYSVSVVARNRGGADTLAVQVRVVPPSARPDTAQADTVADRTLRKPVAERAPAPRRSSRATVPRATLYGSGGVAVERGGYAWVVASDLWEERVRDRMLHYRLQGLRADLYTDTRGSGSPAYRVVLGQFETTHQALVARAWLPKDVSTAWLLELAPSGAGEAGEK